MKRFLIIFIITALVALVIGAVDIYAIDETTTTVEDAWNKYVVGAVAGGSVSGIANMGLAWVSSKFNKKKQEKWDKAITQANTLNNNAKQAFDKVDAIADNIDSKIATMETKLEENQKTLTTTLNKLDELNEKLTESQNRFKASADKIVEMFDENKDV